MAKESGVVYVRMDANLKKQAEAILDELGISAAGAVQMLYRQIIMQNGLPFEAKLKRRVVNFDQLDNESYNDLINEAVDDIENGNVVSLEEANAFFDSLMRGK